MKYRGCEIRISQTYNVLKIQAYKGVSPISGEYTCAIFESNENQRSKSIMDKFISMVKEDIDNHYQQRKINSIVQ